MLHSLKGKKKEFDMIGKIKGKTDNYTARQMGTLQKRYTQWYKYYRMVHQPNTVPGIQQSL